LEEAVQYHGIDGALFTHAEDFLRCIVISTSIPSVFPAQKLRIYGPQGQAGIPEKIYGRREIEGCAPQEIGTRAISVLVVMPQPSPVGIRDAVRPEWPGPPVVRQNEIGGLSMAKSHIAGIEQTDLKQGGQKDWPLASALAGIW